MPPETPSSAPLTALAPSLWVADGPRVRMFGIPFDTRMSVVRLGDGGLWLHSPVPPTPALLEATSALGPVRHLIAPNKLHYLFIEAWRERAPGAAVWAAPGLAERNKAVHIDRELGDRAEAVWAEDLDQLIFAGSAILPEVLFLHRASRTLIATDIFQNHDPARDGWFWRQVKRGLGVVAPKGGTPREWRLSVRDRAAARESLERLLAWEFDRLVFSHGLCIDSGAHAWVERAFHWL
ncbi:DUF4336 domain-containing protein [Haliangium ochraceum]|uniref:DUF4336 domain-containing protein n=1 Tax=Haliangium ochraceum (strain DSM 14365 / JCM 11303 / SMP-2) TaxID=502025 RepID=D0LSU0_HALO1|nr:DUF4336 domain-containing protein [Haliangium ochraceum]ACY17312.1 conserved hypothetical protein [Haliangium ochraceum DSM 14365]